MSIINNQSGIETDLERQVGLIYDITKSTYHNLVLIQKQGIQRAWNNPYGFTPKEIFDELGANSVKLIEFHAALSSLIVEIALMDGIQPDISFPTNAFVKNSDGTITVLDTPYEIGQ